MNSPSLYAQMMSERHGCEVVEYGFGFVTFRIEGEVCTALEIFVRKENRARGFWQKLWNELQEVCRARGANRIVGFVDVAKPDPTSRLAAYLRYGAQVKDVAAGVIILEWSVKNG